MRTSFKQGLLSYAIPLHISVICFNYEEERILKSLFIVRSYISNGQLIAILTSTLLTKMYKSKSLKSLNVLTLKLNMRLILKKNFCIT